jgi:hypothetical protein
MMHRIDTDRTLLVRGRRAGFRSLQRGNRTKRRRVNSSASIFWRFVALKGDNVASSRSSTECVLTFPTSQTERESRAPLLSDFEAMRIIRVRNGQQKRSPGRGEETARAMTGYCVLLDALSEM